MANVLLMVLLGGAGVVAGVVLGGLSLLADRRQNSAEDILVNAIDSQLPQLQCAECGYAGCKPFARAVAKKEAAIDLCLPGGEDVIRRLAALVNESPPQTIKQTPDNKTHSINTISANVNNAGVNVAFINRDDCVGCALCLPVCPTDAIVGAARFAHSVLEKDCTGCALCLPVCPTDAIVMQPPKKRMALNQTLMRFRTKTPSPPPAGQQCIRCNLCVDVCPAGLSPMNLHALSADEQWDKMTAQGLAQCIHCQKCDDVCPSFIPLSMTFAKGKNIAAKTIRAKTEAARLKTRYEERQKRQTPPPAPVINAAAQAKAASLRPSF